MRSTPSERLLTTSEVAELLHVHPKQVYRLLRQGLPAQRLGSEWRFSGRDVLAWAKQGKPEAEEAPVATATERGERPPLLAANGDVAVEILLRLLREGAGRLLGFVQSDRAAALELLQAGAVLAAGCHGEGPPARLGGERMARIHLVTREVGLAGPPGKPVPSLAALSKRRFASRAPSAGLRTLLDAALRKEGLDVAAAHRRASILASHAEVAAAVARGEAEVGLLSRAWADRLGLAFELLDREPYGLIVRASDLGDPRVVALCETAQSAEYRGAVRAVAGYQPDQAGDIRYDAAR